LDIVVWLSIYPEGNCEKMHNSLEGDVETSGNVNSSPRISSETVSHQGKLILNFTYAWNSQLCY